MNNENKKLSRSGRRRVERKSKSDDNMKLVLKKLHLRKKRKIKV